MQIGPTVASSVVGINLRVQCKQALPSECPACQRSTIRQPQRLNRARTADKLLCRMKDITADAQQ